MQDTIYFNIFPKMHTHAYKLTIDGEITFSCCKVLAFQDTYIKDKDFLDFLLESLPQGIPCLRSIRQKIFTASLQATMLFILSVLSVLPLLFI